MQPAASSADLRRTKRFKSKLNQDNLSSLAHDTIDSQTQEKPNEDQHRVIIALDLDAFYVAACRKRDPSLIGLPIGIQQKGILATISYEARQLGVQKLASIKDAIKQCPDLVLVNGEDLSYFR